MVEEVVVVKLVMVLGWREGGGGGVWGLMV